MGESERGRRARLAERDQYVAESDERRRAAERELQQAHEEAKALDAQAVAIREKISAAQRRETEEREQRRREWAELTVAGFDHEFAEAKAGLDAARAALAADVAEPGRAIGLYLALVAAGAKFTAIQERHVRALAASGAAQDPRGSEYAYQGGYFRVRYPHIGTYAEEVGRAVEDHAARVRADASEAVNAEQAAALAGV